MYYEVKKKIRSVCEMLERSARIRDNRIDRYAICKNWARVCQDYAQIFSEIPSHLVFCIPRYFHQEPFKDPDVYAASTKRCLTRDEVTERASFHRCSGSANSEGK